MSGAADSTYEPLPNVQPGDRPPDDHPLDLRRSLEDGEDLGGTGSLRRSAACGPRGISTDSARPVRDECRFRVGPCSVSVVARPHAEKASMRFQGHARQPALQQVHLRYILALTCDHLGVCGTRPGVRGAAGPHAGRTRGGCPENPGLAAIVPTRRVAAGQTASRQRRRAPPCRVTPDAARCEGRSRAHEHAPAVRTPPADPHAQVSLGSGDSLASRTPLLRLGRRDVGSSTGCETEPSNLLCIICIT